jgi:hypothetical protein
MMGIVEQSGPGDLPAAASGAGLEQGDSDVVPSPAVSAWVRPERMVVMYYSSGTPAAERKWWLLSVFILANFILPPMRLRDLFRRWGI